jgi:hypothetical protein
VDKYIIRVKVLAGADVQSVNTEVQSVLRQIDDKQSLSLDSAYAIAGGTGYVVTLDAVDATSATAALMALTIPGQTTATISHVLSLDAYGDYLLNPLGNKK